MKAFTIEARKAELAAVSERLRTHKGDLARRDALIRELAGEIPRAELAALAQVTPGRISQITEKEEV
jgi:hypothetical protein